MSNLTRQVSYRQTPSSPLIRFLQGFNDAFQRIPIIFSLNPTNSPTAANIDVLKTWKKVVKSHAAEAETLKDSLGPGTTTYHTRLNQSIVDINKLTLRLGKLIKRKAKHLRCANRFAAELGSIEKEDIRILKEIFEVGGWMMKPDVSRPHHVVGGLNSKRKYTAFISHAGEDKFTMAVPLWFRLKDCDITAFLDFESLRPGYIAGAEMEEAMQTAMIAIVLLSPEFAAKKWTMKELTVFLQRREKAIREFGLAPVIIPVFYRLPLHQAEDIGVQIGMDSVVGNAFDQCGFGKRLDENPGLLNEVSSALAKTRTFTSIENIERADNKMTKVMLERRENLLVRITDMAVQSSQWVQNLQA